MGGLCTRRSTEDSFSGGSFPHVNGLNYGSGMVYQSRGTPVQPANHNSSSSTIDEGIGDKQQTREGISFPPKNGVAYGLEANGINDGIPYLSRAQSNRTVPTKSNLAAVAKVSEVSSLLGKAGTVGIGKAVEVLDTLGSSMTSLTTSGGFVSGMATKGNKITILSFEIANTIVKGSNLMQSLAKDSIKHLKEVVLPSEGVERLISKDTDELLRIAGVDKREELKVFSGEVVRFGNRCKDPQWHNLDRYFEKLESELIPQKQLQVEAETVMQHLMNLVQYTAELYHELHALDRFEQDFRRKQSEEANPNAPLKGDSLAMLKSELKSQKKHVRSLQKKSLWSKSLEEVMEQLVDIVHFIHMEIHNSFGSADGQILVKNNHQKLGSAGLALHYANVITQINTIVSRSCAVPPSTRDALYQGLPPSIKLALRSKLHSFKPKEELNIPQIRAEMEKILQWLVPIATNTTKAHHGFGWVGEWANTGSCTPAADLIRIQTLHHADKAKTDECILELVVWLHHLVSQSQATTGPTRSPVKSPIRSPNPKGIHLTNGSHSLTIEDQEMLRGVSKRKTTPGISKSQEFTTGNSKSRSKKHHHRLTKSSSHSPARESKKDPFPIKRPSSVPVIDFDVDKIKALDLIDDIRSRAAE